MYDDSDAISLRVQRLKKDPSVETHWGFISRWCSLKSLYIVLTKNMRYEKKKEWVQN